MSAWDSYIDNLIAQTTDSNGTAHCDRACIVGLDGSPWTSAAHPNALKLHGNEAATIGRAFKSKDFSALQASGIVAEGLKYQFLREEDGVLVLGKKKDSGAITCQASKTAIVFGHTKEGAAQGYTNKGVAVIAEYLESLGM
ncbi:profilin [Nocardia sp. NPDC055053]